MINSSFTLSKLKFSPSIFFNSNSFLFIYNTLKTNNVASINLTGLSGLVHWWRCGDGEGDTGGPVGVGIIHDQVGSADLLTIQGSPTLESKILS